MEECQIRLVKVRCSGKFIVSVWGFMHNNRPTRLYNGWYTTYDGACNDDNEYITNAIAGGLVQNLYTLSRRSTYTAVWAALTSFEVKLPKLNAKLCRHIQYSGNFYFVPHNKGSHALIASHFLWERWKCKTETIFFLENCHHISITNFTEE